MSDSQSVMDFNSIVIDNLARNEYGEKSFAQVYGKLAEIYIWIRELINICDTYEIPNSFKNELYNHINRFTGIARSILNYRIEDDAQRNFNGRNNIIGSADNYYNSILLGYEINSDGGRPIANNFLTIRSAIKNEANLNLDDERKSLINLNAELITKKQEVDSLLSLLQKRGTEKTFENYSVIFKDQALKHSNLNLKEKKIGAAERWLFSSLLLTVLFISLIGYLNTIFEIDFDKAVPEVTIQLITRLIVISLFIYIISFSFKQYSVHKHLYTLNLHRSNTLNSYELFIKSISAEDTTTKNALMIEVAKAIYESGATGYISGKESDNSPSIIEFTRYLNQGK